MRAAAYSGTRNIYKQMLTSAKSLLMHSNVEKIYFLIEDDEFPYELPEEIECINISKQTYFPHNGPNFRNVLSYMVLVRAAYTKIFPHLDRILSIDMDTIVNENVSDLWDLDLTDYYLAGVEEVEVSKREGSYINMGVAMMNLKKMREEHKDDELIHNLNTFWYRWCEQDAINQLFRGHILILPNDYNACWQSGPPKHEKITHFAGIYDLKHFPHFDYYEKIPVNELPRNLQDKISLDIIIPTYKNKEGLRRTLNSMPLRDDVNIIVVDDGSNLDYSDILNEYPYIHFYQLDVNIGPGMARQHGIDHSYGSHILFLDTGDYLYDNGLEIIMKHIQENTYIKLYGFSYTYTSTNLSSTEFDNKCIGKVYKRSFLNIYNIRFCREGSYANEDYGFYRSVLRILWYLESRKFAPAYTFINTPVIYEYYDPNSITKADNGEYFYTNLMPGLAINDLHVVKNMLKANLPEWAVIDEVSYILGYEYYLFLCMVHERPDMLYESWDAVRDFYFKGYYTYKHFAEPALKRIFQESIMPLIKKRAKRWNENFPINILRFVKELETEEIVPNRYFIGG